MDGGCDRCERSSLSGDALIVLRGGERRLFLFQGTFVGKGARHGVPVPRFDAD